MVHWMLVRLLRLFPDLPESSPDSHGAQRQFCPAEKHRSPKWPIWDRANRQSFERTYGLGLAC